MGEKILDSSAVLAYLRKEPGWERVETCLQNDDCMWSTVNYAEVVSKLAEKGLQQEAIRGALDALNKAVTLDPDLRNRIRSDSGMRKDPVLKKWIAEL